MHLEWDGKYNYKTQAIDLYLLLILLGYFILEDYFNSLAVTFCEGDSPISIGFTHMIELILPHDKLFRVQEISVC